MYAHSLLSTTVVARALARCLSLLTCLLWLASAPANAAPYPEYTSPVVDAADVLSLSTRTRLTEALQAHRDRVGDEVAVVTVPGLDGVNIGQYALGLARQWRLGQSGRDNGVLIVIAPEERRVRIEVGYGLEDTLRDSDAADIIATSMTPRFRVGDLDGGTRDGVDAVLTRLQNTAVPRVDRGGSGHTMAIPLVFAALFAATHFLDRRRRTHVIGTLIAAGVAAMVINAISGQWLFGVAAGLIAGGAVFLRGQRAAAAGSGGATPPPPGHPGVLEPTHVDDSDPEARSPFHGNRNARPGDNDGGGGGFGGGGASGGW
ncbi:MAG: TPM domain-containing protein [Pseudomonadota bacterium]